MDGSMGMSINLGGMNYILLIVLHRGIIYGLQSFLAYLTNNALRMISGYRCHLSGWKNSISTSLAGDKMVACISTNLNIRVLEESSEDIRS